MKNKFYYLVLITGLVLITASFVRKDKGNNDVINLEGNDKQEETAELNDQSGKNYLEGVLYKSEDLNRGNFKLSSSVGDIYLRTSRDFSALIGFQVLVLINGTKDNFKLVDVQSKVAKDGFLLNQQ